MGKNVILEFINNEYEIIGASDSKARNRVARKIYPLLPSEDEKVMKLFDFLVSTEEWKVFWLVTKWIKRKELYKLEYMTYYEKWLYNYIDSWGKCDLYCYRVLNPMLEKYPKLFQNAIKWSDSAETYIRRAAAVCLLESTQSFKVNYSFKKVITVVEKLKADKEYHVQKGVGWLLKLCLFKLSR